MIRFFVPYEVCRDGDGTIYYGHRYRYTELSGWWPVGLRCVRCDLFCSLDPERRCRRAAWNARHILLTPEEFEGWIGGLK